MKSWAEVGKPVGLHVWEEGRGASAALSAGLAPPVLPHPLRLAPSGHRPHGESAASSLPGDSAYVPVLTFPIIPTSLLA